VVRPRAARVGRLGRFGRFVETPEARRRLARRRLAPVVGRQGAPGDRYCVDERSEFGYLEHDSEGETVFRERSSLNGDVHVVKHGPWRSLRFNEVEQGLSYVRETRDEATGEVLRVTADADVLGYEYLRCMTAAAAAMCRLDVGADWTKVDGVDEKKNASRVVCVGLGSGAMPAFIANAFPELSSRLSRSTTSSWTPRKKRSGCRGSERGARRRRRRRLIKKPGRARARAAIGTSKKPR
jgi:hypothetical protein